MPRIAPARRRQPNWHYQKSTRIPPADHFVESYPGRREVLERYRPQNLTDAQRSAMHDTIVELVGRVPSPNRSGDKHRLSTAWHYGRWCTDVRGLFDPATMMTDDDFEQFLNDSRLTEGSERARRSYLRLLRDGQTIRPAREYNPAPPYPPQDVAAFFEAADALQGVRWGPIAWILLALTMMLGLRGAEAAIARGTDLDDTDGNLIITVPGVGDRADRTIPVTGHAAEILRPRVGNPDYLLLDGLSVRQNVVSYLTQRVLPNHHHAFAGLDGERARNTWLAGIVSELPVRDVQYLAGLGQRTYTANDIAAFLGPPDPDRVRRRLAALPPPYLSR